jgi:hypothetical protein
MKLLLEIKTSTEESRLYATDEPTYCEIEWHNLSYDDVEHIGIWLEKAVFLENRYVKATLCDYDGVYSMPKQGIELLRQAGITVPEEFT